MQGVRTKRGRVGLVLAAAAMMAGLGAGSAYAASETISGTALNTFDKATYTSDQGDLVQFQSLGGSHNATATVKGPDGGPLFESETITGGTTPVNGTQFLSQGSYSFICTVHPTTMQATLVKTGAGSPVPRPDIEVKLISRNLDKAAGKGKLVAQVRAITQSNDIGLEAKLGKTRLGEDDGIDLAGGTKKNVVLKLSRAARNKLAAKSKATVKIEGSVAFGAPDTAKGTLR
jgi:plastocyanin